MARVSRSMDACLEVPIGSIACGFLVGNMGIYYIGII